MSEIIKLEIADQIVAAAQSSSINAVFVIHNISDQQLTILSKKVQYDLGYTNLLLIEKDKVINWDYFKTNGSAVAIVSSQQPKSLPQIANAIRFGGVPGITGSQVLLINADVFKGTNPSHTMDIRVERAIELNAGEGDMLY